MLLACCLKDKTLSISDLNEDDDNFILYRPSSFSLWYMFGSMLMCVLSVLCKEQGITVIVSSRFSIKYKC